MWIEMFLEVVLEINLTFGAKFKGNWGGLKKVRNREEVPVKNTKNSISVDMAPKWFWNWAFLNEVVHSITNTMHPKNQTLH